jgi:hypothetical protein
MYRSTYAGIVVEIRKEQAWQAAALGTLLDTHRDALARSITQ